MQLTEAWHVPVAMLSGVSFSLLGISYRLGKPRGVTPSHVIVVCALIGTAFFAIKSVASPWAELPARVVLGGLVSGGTQYAVVLLVKIALHLGPLSALTCALAIAFLPTSVYAYFAFGEALAPLQYAAFPLALACVVFASLGRKDLLAPGQPDDGTCYASVRYGLLLLLIVLANSVAFIVLKEMATRRYAAPAGVTYLQRFGDVYFVFFYGMLGLCASVHLLIRRDLPRPLRPAILLGCLGGVGSVGGIVTIAACASGPAATVFTASNVSMVGSTALVSALFFGEKRTFHWYATVACGVLTVAAARLDQMLK